MKKQLKYAVYICLVFGAGSIFCMNHEEELAEIIINPNNIECAYIKDIQDRLISGTLLCSSYPDSNCSDRENCWNRLTYLSIFHQMENASPLCKEQADILAKFKHDTLVSQCFLYGGLTVSVLADATGYLTYVGLISSENTLAIILTASTIPTAAIVASLFGLLSINRVTTAWNMAHEDDLTIHQKIEHELEVLAIFLVRQSFSADEISRNSARYIAHLLDVDKLRDGYINHARFNLVQADFAVEPLVEVVEYLKDNHIQGKCMVVSQEIRICRLESQVKL